MKLLLGFVVGMACGAVLMLQLMRTGWFVPGPMASSPSVARIDTSRSPALMIATAAQPTPAVAGAALAAPAAAMSLAPPVEVVAAVSVASMPVPAVSSVSHSDPAGIGAIDVAADVPATAVNDLLIPVQGVQSADLRDTFTQARSANRVHDAIDIMAARGTPVLAVHAGRVVKLFTSKPGGLTVYQLDPSDHVVYYYAHLDSYAPGLAEGQQLQRGDPIGTVGSTGNASADAPHLHFEVQLLGPQKQWWHATSINPYGRFSAQP